MRFTKVLYDMVTSPGGAVSSKRAVGAVCYFAVTLALMVVMFLNPGFPGLTEIVIVNLCTSASLLGLTTVENIKRKKNPRPGESGEEEKDN